MSDKGGSGDKDQIQVIGRAASVLRAVAADRQGMTLTDIARQTGLPRSTIQRIVKSLEDEDFLQPAAIRGGYALGQGLLRIARQPSQDVVAAIDPLLRELAAAVDETVDLSVLRGARALFVSHIAGSHRLAALSAIGAEFPLHSTANGKALLSCLPPQRRQDLVTPPLSADTARTITDPVRLLEEVSAVAASGIAYDMEEHTDGVCAIGAAFLDAIGQPYAISIPVPKQRFLEKQAYLKTCLLEWRARIAGFIVAPVSPRVGTQGDSVQA